MQGPANKRTKWPVWGPLTDLAFVELTDPKTLLHYLLLVVRKLNNACLQRNMNRIAPQNEGKLTLNQIDSKQFLGV